MRTKAQKWGNSLAIRVPRGVAEEASIQAGDVLEIVVIKGRIVLARTQLAQRLRYPLSDLVRRISTKNRYREVDFGAPTGREAW